MDQKVIIFDFGSQYTQLIGRRVRELNYYCEIHPYNAGNEVLDNAAAVILSGSPFSVREENALKFDLKTIIGKFPILSICYGAQLLAHELGGRVERSSSREYGKAILKKVKNDVLLKNISDLSQIWMSHADSILEIPDGFEIIAETHDIPVAAYKSSSDKYNKAIYGLQFHPEVTHTLEGAKLLENFLSKVCNLSPNWTPEAFVESTVSSLKQQLGDEHVVMGLSGGVDSSVAATLLHQAIGDHLHCIFVDNGLLRKNEYKEVLETYNDYGLNVTGVKAADWFLRELKGLTDPEEKRKAIGKVFVEVFQQEADRIKNVSWLGQGTIYPDVIESVSVHGPSVTIKSHHNVGGLPDLLKLKIVEPLRMLFKDEVRRVGEELGLPQKLLGRHPFPGPGLGIRILGEVTYQKVAMLQKADDIFIQGLKSQGLYNKIWQAGVILLPVHSVGVMGDERTYEQVVALRAVSSVDGMTAQWVDLPYDFLAEVSTNIINRVNGINRVVYDISSKPPSTIEWE